MGKIVNGEKRTLEEYLRENYKDNTIDFALRSYFLSIDGEIHFLIHPMNKDGDTVDFIIKGNQLVTEIDTKVITEGSTNKE